MHSLHLLILVLICILHSHLILASGDHDPSNTSPYVVPLDLQPELRRREGAKLFRSLLRSTSDTCPTNYQQCGNGLPSDFCCSSGDTCISLDNNTSALCCPAGSGKCSTIKPITCSLVGQNATAYPTSVVHTLNLDGQLPTCGAEDSGTQTCCPFGYSCNGESNCVLTETETPISTGILATATTSRPSSSMAITTTVTSGSATALVAADPTFAPFVPTLEPVSDKHASSNSSSQSKTKAIGIATGSAVGGVFVVAGFLAFAWLKRRRLKESLNEKRRSVTQRLSSMPPPLPPKEHHQVARKKRRSMLSWVPSVINRTPVELPATPVIQPPNMAHRPYPRDSLSVQEFHELEARWLPQGAY